MAYGSNKKKSKIKKRETFAYLEQNCYKKPEKKEILIMLLLLIPHLLSLNQQQPIAIAIRK